MTRDQIKKDLLAMLMELQEDWEYSGELTEETGIFRDLSLESVDAVALGTEIEAHFGQELPFAEFLAKARDNNRTDITIGYLLEFLSENIGQSTEGKVA